MSYPKKYSFKDTEIEENTAFVIMPFNEEMSIIYGEILQVCLELKISCVRDSDIFNSRVIMDNILDGISTSELIIVDLSQKNPNVYYELGIAHSIRDENSVVLLSQNIDESPFDIKHRSILEYNKLNLPKFKNDLKKRIEINKYSSRKRQFLKTYLKNNRVSESEIQLFLEVSSRISKSKVDLIYNLLKNNDLDYKESDIDSLNSYFAQLDDYNGGIISSSSSLFKMLVFSSDLILNSYSNLAKKILVESNHDIIHLDDPDAFSFIAEYCFRLIEKNKLKTDAISWLLNYLKNYRMGRIDLVRSKIEDFLVRTSDQDVNSSLLKAIRSDSLILREAMADVCGQKNLQESIPFLLDVLKSEKNPYVARSCITALTKLKASDSAEEIFNWMMLNKNKWGKEAVSASLKNIALSALRDLDEQGGFLKSFEAVTKE